MRDTSQRFDPRQEMRRDDFEIFHNQDTHLDAVDCTTTISTRYTCFCAGRWNTASRAGSTARSRGTFY